MCCSYRCLLMVAVHFSVTQYIHVTAYSYFTICENPVLQESVSDQQMNVFHKGFLTWSFQKGLDCFRLGDHRAMRDLEVSQDLVWTDRSVAHPR